MCETDHRQYSTSGVVVNQALWERYCHGERGSAILSNGSGKFALFSSLYGENSVNHTFFVMYLSNTESKHLIFYYQPFSHRDMSSEHAVPVTDLCMYNCY